jgi:hypothetical protein
MEIDITDIACDRAYEVPLTTHKELTMMRAYLISTGAWSVKDAHNMGIESLNEHFINFIKNALKEAREAAPGSPDEGGVDWGKYSSLSENGKVSGDISAEIHEFSPEEAKEFGTSEKFIKIYYNLDA